jgi:hypothetical protein
MHIIRKAHQRHILRNTQTTLLDGCKRCKGDDIIESQNSIWAMIALQKVRCPFESQLIVNLIAEHQFPFNGNVILAQSLQIAMLATAHHIKMIRASDKRNTTTACINEMLSGLLGSFVTIGCHTGEAI